MIDFIKSILNIHIHSFKFDHQNGVNKYLECSCGKRKVETGGNGYSEIDKDWLNDIPSD